MNKNREVILKSGILKRFEKIALDIKRKTVFKLNFVIYDGSLTSFATPRGILAISCSYLYDEDSSCRDFYIDAGEDRVYWNYATKTAFREREIWETKKIDPFKVTNEEIYKWFGFLVTGK